jgi:hypothetical protein
LGESKKGAVSRARVVDCVSTEDDEVIGTVVVCVVVVVFQ